MPRQSRAEATRARLLTATVASLSARGYAGTSTQEVCRRAGVSRGTLQHHFPTRISLLVAALDAILGDRVAQFMTTHRGKGPLQPVDLLRALWPQWKEPVYAAWLELAVAARTEQELRGPLREVMARFDDEILAAFRELLDVSYLPEPFHDAIPFLTFALFNGMAVAQSYEDDDREAQFLELTETLARLLPVFGGGAR
jgi:AcrR family transcriptional regulator